MIAWIIELHCKDLAHLALTQEEANRLRDAAQEHAGSYVPEDAANLILSGLTQLPCIPLEMCETQS